MHLNEQCVVHFLTHFDMLYRTHFCTCCCWWCTQCSIIFKRCNVL